ncbi:heme biosynthesis protein HemY [Xaviernesmea oryzae]|uniref:Heme biosynthesis protein HemY n=1 Tax=Xaviernesmea oryzae TaxID=464029 RepID=A0A1Q9AVT5_9HYPH|nr:heme biosynthesis HemY N-terminal domain-containing protein [Xaviernesmea oryzae]OLP59559.1 heme biosynthesis protein HemY [Xaviernesmea oryzae]SEM13455.1 HemY protein [Xaviernesmea oryzae]
MIKILFYVLIVLGLAAGFSWLADRPGDVTLVWEGQRLETSLVVAATALVVLVLAIFLVIWLVRALISSPGAASRFWRRRKRDRGYHALSTGLVAAGSGDAVLARQMGAKARSLLGARREPLVHLLEAQTALLDGRHEDARRAFEVMSEQEETKALGLRGLYLEAKRLGADEAARQYAARAAEGAPQLGWAVLATLDERARAGDWDEALRLLEVSRRHRAIDKRDFRHKRATLLTARARARIDSDPRSARDDALAALKLDPNLVPAAVAAAQVFYRQDSPRRAASVLERSWRQMPHPDVAETYLRARSGDSALDRLKRARKLEAIRPTSAVALMAVARSALEARDLTLAREKAEAAARLEPTESVFLLLADIEQVDTSDDGRIRHWMSQALKSLPDPVWTADGLTSEDWLPVHPVTGALGVFEWKRPVRSFAGPVEDGKALGEEAIRSLPPVAPAVRPAKTPYAAPTPSELRGTTAPATAADTADKPAAPIEAARPEPRQADKTVPGATEPAAGARPVEPAPKPVAAMPVPSESVIVPEPVPAPQAPKPAQVAKPAPAPKPAPMPAPRREEPIGGRNSAPVEPFFGRPPDDPGVREEKPLENASMRLF